MSTRISDHTLVPPLDLESNSDYQKFKVLNERSKSHSVGVALCVGALFGLAVVSASFFCTVPASYALLTVGGVLFLGGIPGIILLVKHQTLQESVETQSNPDEITKNLIPPGPILSVQVAPGPIPTDIVQVPTNSKEILDVPHQKNPEALSEKQQAQNLLAKMLKHPSNVTEDLIANNPHLFPKDNKFHPVDFKNYKSQLLHKISRDGSPLLLEAYLELDKKHSDKINSADTSSFLKTPLNLAIESGDLDKVKILLDKGADPKNGDMWGSAVDFSILYGTCEIVSYFLEKGIIEQIEIIQVLMDTGEITSEIYGLLLDHIIDEVSEKQLTGIFHGLFKIPDIKHLNPNQRIENFQLFYDKWKSHPNFGQFLNQKIDTEKTQNGPLNICRTELFQLALYALIFSPSNIKKVVHYAIANRDLFTMETLFRNELLFYLFLSQSDLQDFFEKALQIQDDCHTEKDKIFLRAAAEEYAKIGLPSSTKNIETAVALDETDENASEEIIIIEDKRD